MTPARSLALAAALAIIGPAAAATTEPECTGGGDPEITIKACTRLIEFAGLERRDLAQAYFTRGTYWAHLANHDRAIVDFNTALELDPNLTAAWFNRALAHSERGDHGRAAADYDAVLRLSPREIRAYLGRAVEWTLLGEHKRAIADYDAAIKLEPESFDAYYGRGRVRFYAGDFAGAASDFLRIHRIAPTAYTAIWIYLARKRVDIPGEKALAQEAGTRGEGDWPAPVVGLYLGALAPEAVLKAAGHADARRDREQRCEALFYVAQWHILRGARDAASKLLRDARGVCPTNFVEHEATVAELRRLQ